VDILMGTFTKAFGSVGGYLAGDKVRSLACCRLENAVVFIACLFPVQDLIQYIRQVCYATQCSAPLSPPAVQQAISAFKIILGEDGTDIGAQHCQTLPLACSRVWLLG
jgi:serine palmitoyltransferase